MGLLVDIVQIMLHIRRSLLSQSLVVIRGFVHDEVTPINDIPTQNPNDLRLRQNHQLVLLGYLDMEERSRILQDMLLW